MYNNNFYIRDLNYLSSFKAYEFRIYLLYLYPIYLSFVKQPLKSVLQSLILNLREIVGYEVDVNKVKNVEHELKKCITKLGDIFGVRVYFFCIYMSLKNPLTV